MEFMVSRTSEWSDEKPCDEAVRSVRDFVEVRTLSSPEEFDKKFAHIEGKWLSKGDDHTVNKDGFIQRTIPNSYDVWVVNLNTIVELIDYIEKYGDIVITPMINGIAIEIYDGYRE